VSDREQITDVILRYGTGIDSRDWELFRGCFTADCELDYGSVGRWSSAEAVTEFMRRTHSGPSQHRLTNIVVTVEGDRARARTYVDVIAHGRNGIGGGNAIGYYDDELMRTDQGWRIARRTYTAVRLTFLGPLRIIPSRLAMRLAAMATRRHR
jgi:hypothetical protein